MNNNEELNIVGAWLPGEVLFNPELTYMDSMVFWMINSLDGENHCYATNGYIAFYLNVTPQTVSNSISKLKDLEYIKDVSIKVKKSTLRILKVNQDYNKKWNHLLLRFNRPYKKNYMGVIKNIITDYNRVNINDTKVSSQDCSLIIPKFIDRNKLKDVEVKLTFKIENINKAILLWNSKGKPFTTHSLNKYTKTVEHIESYLSKKIKRHKLTLKDITEVICLYYKFITSPNFDVLIEKPLTMDRFIYDKGNFINRDKRYKKKKVIDSWFEECLKGRDYLLKEYGMYVENKNPILTEKIWVLWKKNKLKISKDATYMENNFRIAADKVSAFVVENSARIKLNKMEKKPLMFINYVFNAALNGGDTERMRPGSISNDYFYTEILPTYLKKNGFMS